MDVMQLQRQFFMYGISMLREGDLDDQFTQLQKLADERKPNFVFEVITIFLKDSERILNNLTTALEKPIVDFKEVASHAHQIKGSSSSVGAKKVKNLCIAFKAFCDEQNAEGCIRCLHQLKQEYAIMKSKLGTLLTLEQQILAAGGAVPVLIE